MSCSGSSLPTWLVDFLTREDQPPRPGTVMSAPNGGFRLVPVQITHVPVGTAQSFPRDGRRSSAQTEHATRLLNRGQYSCPTARFDGGPCIFSCCLFHVCYSLGHVVRYIKLSSAHGWWVSPNQHRRVPTRSLCRFSWRSHGCFLVLYLTLSSVKYSVFKCIWRLPVAELTENSAFFQATICFDHERTFSGIALRYKEK